MAVLCWSLATWTGQVGHSRLLRLELASGSVTDLAASLDRNVMPGGPAYPGGLAGRSPATRSCSASATAAAPTCTPYRSPAARPRVLGRRVVSGLSVAAESPRPSLTTPTSYGEIVPSTWRPSASQHADDHGATLAEVEHFRARSASSRSPTAPWCTAWLVRDPEATGPQPLLLDVHGGPHNAWNGAADEMHLYHQELVARGWTVLLVNPRGSDGYGEDVLHRRPRRAGVRPTPRTSSSRSTSSWPRASPTRTGSPSPATATAAS